MKKQSEIDNRQLATASPDGSAIEKPPKADRVFISVKDIKVKDNTRSSMDEDSLFQLAGSMKTIGLLEPVIVHKVGKKFVMIAGHRRLTAAIRNGEDLIKAEVYDALDAKTVVRMQLAENLQDEALNHIDIARRLGEARDAGMTNAEIAADINKSDDYVRKHLDLLRLAQPVAELVASGRLPVKQAELIARVGWPGKQILLAERATGQMYNHAKETWQHDRDTIDDKIDDYIQPMDELRGGVARAMQGLAACGWPMGEKFAGKRPCENCPDNTATYADQPALFAGINPRGSAKKGHCTNEACYKAKTIEQNKVREARRKEAEEKTKAKIKKAHDAGLEVCEDCTRVIDSPDDLTDVQGRMLCAKCVEKQQKKADSGYGGGESYEARQKRVNALKRKFPWQTDHKFAKALHDYGTDLAKAIGKCIEDSPMADVEEIILLAVISGESWLSSDEWKLMPSLSDLAGSGQFSKEALAMLWNKAELSGENQPHVNYEGKVRNVPLPEEHVGYIDELETLGKHWGVADLPERPTMKGIEHGEIIKVILKGKKPEALAAIAACEDVGPLEYLLLPKAVNNIAKIAAWRVKAIVARVEQLKGKAPSKDSAVASPTCQGEASRRSKAETEAKRSPKKKTKAGTHKTKPPTADKPSRVNKSKVLIDTERIEVKVLGTKRTKLIVEVALAPDGRWRRSVSVACGFASFSYSPSVQTPGHENRTEAIIAGLHEIDDHLRDMSDRGTESKAAAAENKKALAAVEGRLADFTKADPAPSDSAVASPEPASEQLGQINKDTPLGRRFEFENKDGPIFTLTLIKRTKKEFTFLNAKSEKVGLGVDQWGMIWSPNCVGYTDPTGNCDFGVISDGAKVDALPEILACTDLAALKHINMCGVKGDWRRAAVRKRIEELEKEQATDGETREK